MSSSESGSASSSGSSSGSSSRSAPPEALSSTPHPHLPNMSVISEAELQAAPESYKEYHNLLYRLPGPVFDPNIRPLPAHGIAKNVKINHLSFPLDGASCALFAAAQLNKENIFIGYILQWKGKKYTCILGFTNTVDASESSKTTRHYVFSADVTIQEQQGYYKIDFIDPLIVSRRRVDKSKKAFKCSITGRSTELDVKHYFEAGYITEELKGQISAALADMYSKHLVDSNHEHASQYTPQMEPPLPGSIRDSVLKLAQLSPAEFNTKNFVRLWLLCGLEIDYVTDESLLLVLFNHFTESRRMILVKLESLMREDEDLIEAAHAYVNSKRRARAPAPAPAPAPARARAPATPARTTSTTSGSRTTSTTSPLGTRLPQPPSTTTRSDPTHIPTPSSVASTPPPSQEIPSTTNMDTQ
eukprot:TRINITY_DN6499_c0_g1_i1.p1 TRINITY_DN6499_c0_g1~~TRINITY_DN6499_c0_g1_i1.p1  ORF type:complete len:415 (+),score=48.74 TRINITY_DN6499_c0_g1_i1:1-1245(+)